MQEISDFFNSRNKKKKIPLMTGEEVDMDLSAMEWVHLMGQIYICIYKHDTIISKKYTYMSDKLSWRI